mmetsp:Transcript_13374/g.34285  ORF Transcript_13374/g.34285 Transcript_13374/m.34285 type:complete len:146 (-) Transcript_13374:200-637(-)
MLSIVTSALAFNAGMMPTQASARTPAVSMATALERPFVYEQNPVSLGKSLGEVMGPNAMEGFVGKLVPTNAHVGSGAKPIAGKFVGTRVPLGASLEKHMPYTGPMQPLKAPKAQKPMEASFCYGAPTQSPPCGVAHHDGSGTGPW